VKREGESVGKKGGEKISLDENGLDVSSWEKGEGARTDDRVQVLSVSDEARV